MANAYSGVRTVAGDGAVISTLQRAAVDNIVHKLRADKGLVAKMYLMAKKRSTNQREFSWHVQAPLARAFTTTAGTASNSTTITVGTTAILGLTELDVLRHQDSRETMQVTAVNNGAGTATVVRSVGGTAAATIDSGDVLIRLSKAKPEGGYDVASAHNQGDPYSNYCQIFEETFEITRTAEDISRKGGLYTDGAQSADLRAQMIYEFHADLDSQLRWGEKGVRIDSDGKEVRYTGGLEEFTPAANKLTASTLTELSLITWLESIEFISDDAVLICGTAVANRLARLFDSYRHTTETSNGSTKWGMAMGSFMSPSGIGFRVVVDRHILRGALAGYAFLVSPKDMEVRELHPLEVQKGRQPNNKDTVAERIFCESGPAFLVPERFGMILGVTVPS